jgi:uncharacterized coiled-coil DUF342 family protein
MSREKTTVSVPVETKVAKEFTRKCEEAGLKKTDALRQFIQEFSISSETEELELREEQLQNEIKELETEKKRVERKLSGKKSQLELVREKIDDLESEQADYEELVERLVKKKKQGYMVITLPQFEQAVELGDITARELEELVNERADGEKSDEQGSFGNSGDNAGVGL